MAKLYKIMTTRGFPAAERRRAGLTIPRGGQVVTELTKHQKEAIENDSYLEITEAKEGEQSQAAVLPEGAGVTSTAGVGPDTPDRAASESDQAGEDQPAGEAQAPSGDAAGAEESEGLTPTEPVSGEAGSEAGAGAGAEPAEGLTPTEPVSGEAGSEPAPDASAEDAAEDQPAGENAQESVENNAGEGSDASAEEQALAQSTADQVQPGTETQPSAEDLARDNSRADLDAMAKDAGVVDADKLDNKLLVAQAIVEKRA